VILAVHVSVQWIQKVMEFDKLKMISKSISFDIQVLLLIKSKFLKNVKIFSGFNVHVRIYSDLVNIYI